MIQITVDIASLTKEQREHVSGFILTYPSVSTKAQTLGPVNPQFTIPETKPKHLDLTKAVGGGLSTTLDPADDPSVGAPSPVDAFGDPVAQAFGGASIPLPHGATAAPFTAVANQSPTVPVVPSVTGANTSTVPLPPAPPAAPLATTVAPTVTNPVPVDSDHMPWDARIHSSNKKTIGDGKWQKRRGVDQALVVTVEAELRQLMGLPTPPATPDGAWPFPTPVPQTAPQAAPVLTVPQTAPQAAPVLTVPPPAAAPVLTVPPSPVTTVDPKTEWLNLIREATAAQHAGKITPAEVAQCCGKHGVAALALLVNRLDLVAPIAADIRAIIASR